MAYIDIGGAAPELTQSYIESFDFYLNVFSQSDDSDFSYETTKEHNNEFEGCETPGQMVCRDLGTDDAHEGRDLGYSLTHDFDFGY